MNWLAGYGLLAHGIIFGALACLLPLGEFRQRVALAATTLAMLIGIAPALHGVFGTPSVTLLQLAALLLLGRPSPMTFRSAAGLLVFAVIFYPMALGFGPFDPYSLGYQPWPLLAALGPVGIALWLRQLNVWLVILALDLLAYASGLFANLWDVLFDPLLVLVALAIVAQRGLIRFIAARRR